VVDAVHLGNTVPWVLAEAQAALGTERP
jgi:hypothetical protein